MNYGQIRFRVAKEVPGIDLDLLDGYLLDRYTSMLDRLKWTRQRTEYTFDTAAAVTAGTIAVTVGSNTAAITGIAVGAVLAGMKLQVTGEDELYSVSNPQTVGGAVQIALDRPYTGGTGGAMSGNALAYQLVQPFYTLPASTRILESGRILDFDAVLTKMSRADLNATAPSRTAIGVPRIVALAIDEGSSPPLMTVELYPAPDQAYSIALDLILDAAAPNASGTTTSLLPWMRPSALVAGGCADAFAHQEKWGAADRMEAKYGVYLEDMVRTEALNRGPQQVQPAAWLTRHNLERAMRSATNRTGPRMP